MDSDTAGMIATAAAALAVLGLIVSALLARRLRRLRAVQEMVSGPSGKRRLVDHAAELDHRLTALGDEVSDGFGRLEDRDAELAALLRGAIARCAVIRYDAMGEMTGQQSSSVALLDAEGTGVILSSILHREQARLYAKPIVGGGSEFELSPEEHQALEAAMRDGA